MLGLASSEGLGVDEPIVLGVRADPEPVNACFTRETESPVVKADPGAVHLAAAEQLELK